MLISPKLTGYALFFTMRSANMRVTMCSRAIIFLVGAVYICHQVLAANVFIAELLVESNVTLEAQTILTALNETGAITVNNTKVTFSEHRLIAECLIVGDETTCNCSVGYVWSNEVCYTSDCCTETTCKKNVSLITPLCVAKTKVDINGTITLASTLTWDSTKTNTLETTLKKLNGFEGVNVTAQREGNTIVEFEAAVHVRLNTSQLQKLVYDLEGSLTGKLKVDTSGMVNIESPNSTVCYESTPTLKCKFEEETDSAVWSMSTQHQRFQLNTGIVVELINNCANETYKSCTGVILKKVTEIWSGTYECGFTRGSLTHKAKTRMRVALLPDVITMKIDPLTADCSKKLESASIDVDVTATILNSSESFKVSWSYMNKPLHDLSNRTDGDFLIYEFKAPISCVKIEEAQTITVTFKNAKGQIKNGSINVPVIYEGKPFCREEVVNGSFWPNTPAGDTVINRTCPAGRVGFSSRTCEGRKWQQVYHSCVNEELNKVVNAADNFLKGLGATQEVAMDIFSGLKNNSVYDPDEVETMADTSASINILNVMANASGRVVLQEDVLYDFAEAASNMLNKTWEGVNKSTVENMSADYLQSVEGLVKNVRVNDDRGLEEEKLDLKFCMGGECNVSVFGINMNLNSSSGPVKAVAVKNLTDKLRNNLDRQPSSLLISVTQENKTNSTLIRLAFPKEKHKYTIPSCVYWDTKKEEWSDKGCNVTTNDGNDTVCECDHLTSFAVLFAKSDVSTAVLDMITNVGLGVSVCSLLIFLVIESLVWSAVVKSNLSHFRHTALVNIALFLLLADCCFLASTSPKTLSKTVCLVLTVCKHLFYLAMFSWMMCMSVMLVHQLIFVFSPLRKRVFMFLSSIVGYVCPILIVGSSYVYCKYTETEYFDPNTCWLRYESLLKGSMHAFILPVGTVILTNLFSMVVVILTLTKSSVPEGSKADDKETAKSILKVVVFLTPVFGVTWIIGFALLIIDETTPMFQVALYSFTILNSFQGLLILITGCIAEVKVREELLKLITAKSRRGKSESLKNLTSTTYTKDK
ncbi:adhesion G protein-coupled receptor F5 [Sparus aurata]|uniref:adhesion G protein-coupled receptor F5 n=1 Tax=Sparus aurata TaxID=8175 RepID=UPI0011C0DBF3|nr:adhesion G protein-coupled receptor F5-like [Sparus aurata]